VYPSNPEEKARCRWYEQYAGSTMAEAFWPLITERVINGMIYNKAVDESVVETSLSEKIPAVMDFIDSELTVSEFLLGNTITMADVAITGIYINAMAAGFELDTERWPLAAAHCFRVYGDPVVAKLLEMLQAAAAEQLNVDVQL
jgi:glutathione S-transferase